MSEMKQQRCMPESMKRQMATNQRRPSFERRDVDADEGEIRRAIIAACVEMNASGINQGMSGNISVRHRDGMLITPTSIPYNAMEPDDIVYMSGDKQVAGRRQPSSEWRFHFVILKNREDLNAIVHAHPTYATILAILNKDIPPLHYMIAVAGGHNIRCAPYATFGTEQLSRNAIEALTDRRACLLAHHGMIAGGSTLDKAMWLAHEVETLARQYHGCLQVGPPPLLSEQEIETVISKMADYGGRKPSS